MSFTIAEIVQVLWRQKWLCAWTAAVSLIILLTIILLLTQQYRATALVQINPRQTQVVNFDAVLSGLPADTATIATEIEVMKSRKIAQQTVEKLELQSNPEFNPNLRAPGIGEYLVARLFSFTNTATAAGAIPDGTSSSTERTSDSDAARASSASLLDTVLPAWLGAEEQERVESELENPAEFAQNQRSLIIKEFRKRLKVEPQGRARVISVSFSSEKPELAAQAANTLADFYIVSQLEAKFEAAERANKWLNERIAELREEVRTAERAVEEFRNEQGLLRGGTDATLVEEQVTDLNTRYIEERTLLAEALARLRQAQRLLGSEQGMETAGEVLNSETIRDLRREEVEVQRRVAELSQEFGEQHPRMINARAELRDVRENIQNEIAKIVQNLRNEVAVARARTASVKQALNQVKNEVGSLNASEVQLRDLEREAAASRDLLEQLLTRSKQTASQTDFQQPDATVITEASTPDQPYFPNKKLFGIAALAFSLVLGSAVGFGADTLRRGYRSADELRAHFDVRSLGLLPTVPGVRRFGTKPQDYVVEKPLSALSESLRTLHTNLLLADVTAKPKTVLFTSALPNEGKTSTVVSLTRLLSKSGHRAIALDCDLRRQSIAKAFGAEETAGLIECLKGEIDLPDIIRKDTLTDANFICTGLRKDHVPELLDSVEMQKLLKTLSREYDIVLIDSAPVLAVADTLFLGRLVDKTVFIIRWAETRRDSAQLAFQKLRDAHCDIAGIVLSIVNVKRHGHYNYSDSGVYSGQLKKYYNE